MSGTTLPAPPLSPESEAFYAAAKEGRFLIRRCTTCIKAHWYPRANCPFCAGDTEWIEASGRGTIYSFSPMRRVTPPYTLAYVTLEEGPAIMTNLVDCDPDTLSIGQLVLIHWVHASDGTPVPCFRPG